MWDTFEQKSRSWAEARGCLTRTGRQPRHMGRGHTHGNGQDRWMFCQQSSDDAKWGKGMSMWCTIIGPECQLVSLDVSLSHRSNNLLTLNCDNGDRYYSLSEVTRDNSDKMTRHSTFTRHWLSLSWSRHSRLERLLCPGLGPDGAGSSSGQAGLCIGNQVAVWLVALVLPLNHTMTRVACPPGPASGHSPGLCHYIRGQARSQPCSASLTWQGPSLSLSRCHDISQALSCFRVPDVHNCLLSDWRLVTTALCPQLTAQ